MSYDEDDPKTRKPVRGPPAVLHPATNQVTGPGQMWAAVISRAVRDWHLYEESEDPIERHRGLEAKAWVFSEDESLGSFTYACEAVGVTPDLVRTRAKKLTRDHASRYRWVDLWAWKNWRES
jgi:hypothetical protein